MPSVSLTTGQIEGLPRPTAAAALTVPAQRAKVTFDQDALDLILDRADGYPYLLQQWGETVWREAEGPAITLRDAEAAEPEVLAGTAGASARREYDHRRQKREDRARKRLGRVGIVLARVSGEPQSTKAWQQGAKGEEMVGKRLEKHLANSRVRLLHDRRVPGHAQANIDHITIGPGGITVIDAKNYAGKVRVTQVGGLFSQRTILEIRGRDRTKLVNAVAKQVELVRAALAAAGTVDVDLAGALCFANVDGLPLLSHQRLNGVTIDGPRRVAKLANRPGDLNTDAIEYLWQLIGRAFPPA